VKGEIYDGRSAWRAANVGPVIKFSPLDPQRSARFNPLNGVRSESMYLWEDARFLADMMIVPKAKEPFWEDKAKEILTAIIADVAFWNPPDDRAMSKVLSLVNRNGWDAFIDRMRKNPELETMRDEGSNLAQMDARTLDGALQTAKASLSAWVGERINMVTRQSDWSPLDLRNGTNPTLYVCVKPNEIEAYLSLLRVVIAQHIRALTSELPPRGAAPILFVLDEMPRLKHMPPVEEALEVGRQYGIKLWMFAQSVGQMKTAYPNGEGMMGSCAVRTFMNPSMQDGTAKMLAEQIGMRSGEEHGGKDGKDPISRADTLVVEATSLAGLEFKELQVVMGVGSKPAKVRKIRAMNPTLQARMGAVQPAEKARRLRRNPHSTRKAPHATHTFQDTGAEDEVRRAGNIFAASAAGAQTAAVIIVQTNLNGMPVIGEVSRSAGALADLNAGQNNTVPLLSVENMKVVQKAGTGGKSSCTVGESVQVRYLVNTTVAGRIMKTNGAYCEIDSSGSGFTGWSKCSDTLRASGGTRHLRPPDRRALAGRQPRPARNRLDPG
jgi:type IV secretory pathway TraG/TraD family ATPase VirD4